MTKGETQNIGTQQATDLYENPVRHWDQSIVDVDNTQADVYFRVLGGVGQTSIYNVKEEGYRQVLEDMQIDPEVAPEKD